MKTRCVDFLKALPGFSREKRVLCAVSGGGDSVALLLLMLEAGEAMGFSVAAAHYNHGLRETAIRDEEYVKALCGGLGVPFYCERGDVSAAAGGSALEETARDMRYDFLQRTAQENGCDYIATAHTGDDNLETMLLNMVRGSAGRGLSGIPPVRGNIIRPLLGYTGGELRRFLDEKGVEYMTDETNFQPICSRNRIRLEAVPVLKEINGSAAENAFRAAAMLRRDGDFIDGAAERAYAELVKSEGGGFAVSAEKLRALHPAVSSRVVSMLCPGAASANIDAVLALCASTAATKKIDIPGAKVTRRYDTLFFGKEEQAAQFEETALSEGVTVLPGFEIILEAGNKVYNSEMTFNIKSSTIQGNLRVRPRKTGDRIKLPGRPEKTLKKLLIDEKVPADRRNLLAVVADDSGVVALEGFGVDERHVGRDLTVKISRFSPLRKSETI